MVELKNIKRSYRRLEDLCMGNDIGWFFSDVIKVDPIQIEKCKRPIGYRVLEG